MTTTPRTGDRFRHARQLDTDWRPGPGQRYADAPKAIMVVTRIASGRVWYGVESNLFPRPSRLPHGSFVADLAGLDDVVAEWLDR